MSQNVANADTPGYVARDLPAFETLYGGTQQTDTQRATRSGHMHGTQADQPAPIIDMPGDGSPNGNQVSLEVELLNSVDAKRQHDRALAIYRASLGMLRSTLSKQ